MRTICYSKKLFECGQYPQMEFDRLETGSAGSQKAASAYRKGCEAKQMEQGQIATISVNPLVLRQATCQMPGHR